MVIQRPCYVLRQVHVDDTLQVVGKTRRSGCGGCLIENAWPLPLDIRNPLVHVDFHLKLDATKLQARPQRMEEEHFVSQPVLTGH